MLKIIYLLAQCLHSKKSFNNLKTFSYSFKFHPNQIRDIICWNCFIWHTHTFYWFRCTITITTLNIIMYIFIRCLTILECFSYILRVIWAFRCAYELIIVIENLYTLSPWNNRNILRFLGYYFKSRLKFSWDKTCLCFFLVFLLIQFLRNWISYFLKKTLVIGSFSYEF